MGHLLIARVFDRAVQSMAGNVVHLPKLTPQARARWNGIPKHGQTSILENVICVHCKGSAMKLKSGKMERGMLILEGTCAKCGGKVVRCVEPEK